MRIAFMGASGTGKSTLAQWLVSPEGPEITRGLPICPVGSRSTAKALGFVGPDGEGRPYDVDLADLEVYQDALSAGHSPRYAAEDAVAARSGMDTTFGRSCRALFQRKLAADKIAWESAVAQPKQHDATWKDRIYNAIHARSFVTDRTPLDDVAYAIMHCREVVDEAFLARAIEHTQTYNLIIFCPRDVFQQTAGDAARLVDPAYHVLYEVVLGGLVVRAEACGAMNILTLNKADMEERKGAIRAALAREERRARHAQLREEAEAAE